MTTETQVSIKDIITVLNWFVARERQRGTHFPDHIGDALKRLGAHLLNPADVARKKLEDAKARRSQLIAKRGELAVLMSDHEQLLTADAHRRSDPQKVRQAAGLVRRTAENAPRTAGAYDKCVKELAEVEAEIARLKSETTKAAIAA
jgi:hypothetical protein